MPILPLTVLYEGVHTAVLSQEHEVWVRTEAEPGWLAGPGRSVLLDIHQAIYDAVAAGDAAAAQTAVLRDHEVMLAHLAGGARFRVKAGNYLACLPTLGNRWLLVSPDRMSPSLTTWG
jgi:hypothetical protein